MLKTEKDRLNYGNILLPPEGYKLEKAVGTSYSLDLEALTAVAITLGLKEETDSELKNNPICLLNAIRNVSNKILLFCEAGQIKLPQKPSALCLLLEKMVIPVALPKKAKMSRYPAFHPKVWLVQYCNDKGERTYRFIVLSRNLTFDRSWDVSVVLESNQELEAPEKTKPIVDFLQYLNSNISENYKSDKEKKSIIRSLCNELKNVTFDTDSKEFKDFLVMPLGIGRKQYDMNNTALLLDSFHDLVVMSPFLSASTIKNWNSDVKGLKNCNRTLITRKSELGKLKASDVNNFRIFTMKDTIIDGEDSFSDEKMEKQKQDIHAKIYLRRKDSYTEFFLGSMNASYAAVNQNVEMMICLQSQNRYLNSAILLKDLFNGAPENPENPFEESGIEDVLETSEGDEKNKMEQMIKNICRMNGRAAITARDEKFDLSISFDAEDVEEKYSNVFVSPLRSKKEAEFAADVKIYELDMLQLSEFYIVKVKGENETMERVIMIPTYGLPDDRESAVVNSIVNDKKTFIEYIAFVLGDDYLLTYLEKQKMGESGMFRNSSFGTPAIYEKLLKTALNEPERLQEITYLMNMITDESIIPEEFREIYEMFRKILRLK